MSHARVEEVVESDPKIDGPANLLPQSYAHALRPARPSPLPQNSAQQPSQSSIMTSASQSQSPADILRGGSDDETSRRAVKHYCMLYPCYFSSSRTRSEGRRVAKHLAVPDPLAYNMLVAVRDYVDPEKNQMNVVLEPYKTHPKDWSNPGRVRIQLFDEKSREPLHPVIRNKRQLFNEIAKHMQKYPTKKEHSLDSLKVPIAGLSAPEEFLETQVARPRGWKTMNQILPLHSRAVGGGGVDDDFFKEALRELQKSRKS